MDEEEQSTIDEALSIVQGKQSQEPSQKQPVAQKPEPPTHGKNEVGSRLLVWWQVSSAPL